MKAIVLAGILSFSGLFHLHADSSQLGLMGIVSVGPRKAALLRHDYEARSYHVLILSEGQRERPVEVSKINPQERSVEVRLGKEDPIVLKLNDPPDTTFPGIVFEDAPFDSIMKFYAEFANRTLLRSPRLKRDPVTLKASASENETAALAIERMLAEREISVIPDGPKFTMIVPKDEAGKIKPHAPTSGPSQSEKQSIKQPDDIIPSGVINFAEVSIIEVFKIFAELTGRKLDFTGPFPSGATIIFRNQTEMTKADVVYALDTLFRWNGVQLVEVEKGSLKPLPFP